ncbi:MAG: amino acid adenylation domain-containing protein, partial [bacterium]|nr:amino acid adenylation domain-containing protein [bacterium]
MLEKKNIQDILPLMSLQEGMLYHYLKEPQDDQYKIQLHLRLKGDVKFSVFKGAWDYLIKSNEVLRSVFRWLGVQQPVQIIIKKYRANIEFIDLSDFNEKDKVKEYNNVRKKIHTHRIELDKMPYKIFLICLSKQSYEMVITYHHILYDGWSNGILLKDFFLAYNKLSNGIILPELNKCEFKKFIKIVNNQNKNEQKEFWTSFLKGYEPYGALSVQKTSIVSQMNKVSDKTKKRNIRNFKYTLHEDIENGIDCDALSPRLTLSGLLFTAWGILLQKYNNCRDVVFGTTVSGRSVNLNGINEMIGLFINTIPLRVKSEKETTVSDLFFELTDNVLRRNKFENTPLVDILEYTNNNTQLFDTIMVVENYPLDNSSWSNCNDLSVESYEMLNDITNYSLTLNVEISKSLEINVVYNGDSYDDYVICNMMEHLKLIIDHMIKDPDVSVSSICTITDKEKQKIFNDFNNTDYPYAFHKDIYSMFYDQACMATNRKALLTQNNEFTYGELEKRAGQLADILLKKNIKKEDFVGVYIDRSINMIISIFGILRSGGSYLPIDPKLPKKKVSYIVDDSKTALIITEKKYASIVKEFCECLVIDDEIMLEDAAALRPESAPNSIAYSIYTSGTTGNAKGILIENHSVINRIQWMQKKFPIDHTDVILQKTPIAFDVSVWELFWWSFQGASLALLEPGKESDPKAIIDAIKKYRVTTMHFVPSMLNVFLEYVEKLGNIKDIASLKRVFASGEVLTIAHVEKFNKLLKKSNGTQLINLYGPTEATIDVSYFDCSVPYNKNIIPIGRAIDNIKLYILDKDNLLQSIGVPGELCISGVGLAREYLNNPQLTNEKFILSPFGDGKRLYQTGDRARYLLDGNIEFLGRLDYQVKLRGFRIELSEIERCMISHERIENSIVLFKEDKNGNNYLVGYYTVTKESLSDNITIEDLRSFLINLLPEYMVPVKLIQMDQFTLTINGKVDRKSLPETDEIYLEKKHVIIPPFSDIEKSLLDIWIDILDRDKISVNDHFFDVGGNSLLLIRLVSKLSIVFDIEISITNIFKYPTIKKLSNYIKELKLEKSPILQSNTDSKKRMQNVEKINGNSDIAIIGMSGKFPGSENIEEFWENLENGNECITFFDDEDLLNEGIEKTLLQNPDYVKAKGFFTDADYFDANFFGYTPKEAQIMDPQIRALHEHCWIALEDAGYNPFDYSGLIGLFVGASNNYHWISGVVDNIKNTPGQFQVNLLNDRDFLSTHISYKLDLKGPSLTIQTACSTSLVAVDTAITNLIQKKCDIAMAGGVSITFPLVDGYLYQDGMINSPDGHCRAFDADANGTLLGNGAGIVVLKRLEDAQRDRDNIYAVIKSSSINNDGSDKIGYSAPSIDGQIKVIQDAQKKAGIDPESIDYIEAHGTGTILGDPIEIEALTQAFNTNQKGFCALGSVKSNIGHLDAAAGIAGLIKTVLSVNHLLIPPSLNYSKPNPKIDFENSPFYVNKTLQIWDNSKKKARAGVSSFGIGGTNAHIIVEEPPRLSSDKDSYSDNVIIISGNSYDVLYNTSKALLNYLKKNRDIKLDALAYTLQTGRKSFNFRQYFIGSDIN